MAEVENRLNQRGKLTRKMPRCQYCDWPIEVIVNVKTVGYLKSPVDAKCFSEQPNSMNLEPAVDMVLTVHSTNREFSSKMKGIAFYNLPQAILMKKIVAYRFCVFCQRRFGGASVYMDVGVLLEWHE
jgi:hypothetical protein